jgi:hypothetical protein
MAAEVWKGSVMRHFYAIAEPDGTGSGWWLSFPGQDGITSAAASASLIVSQARDALESALMYGGPLPRSIEDGANVPTSLDDYAPGALIVVVPFEPVRALA